jgi:hypothetical protein
MYRPGNKGEGLFNIRVLAPDGETARKAGLPSSRNSYPLLRLLARSDWHDTVPTCIAFSEKAFKLIRKTLVRGRALEKASITRVTPNSQTHRL